MAIMDYKCPNCGGAINFDVNAQKVTCPFCDTEFDMETLQGYDDILKSDTPDEMNWNGGSNEEWSAEERDGLSVYTCQSCGGEIIGDDTMGSTACPYCGNNVVIPSKWSGGLKPDFVIPFKFDKKAAKEALKNHFKGKVLLPKVFKNENHIEEIKGLYVPFWIFDAKASGRGRFKATKVRHWSDNDYNYTETSHYSVTRAGRLKFENVPADASKKMDDDLMQSLEPFNAKEAVDFQTAYLAGYLADKYDVEVEEAEIIANGRIKTSVEDKLRSTVTGYSSVSTESMNVSLSDAGVNYSLYPVWLLNTSWNGKLYTFAMNGQTGKFVGNLPVDKKLAGLIFAGSTVLLTVILYLIGIFL